MSEKGKRYITIDLKILGSVLAFLFTFCVSQQSCAIEEYANVLIVRKPFPAEGEPLVYQSFHVPDWTRDANSITAGEVTVERDLLVSGHLVPATSITLTGVVGDPADFAVLLNQEESDSSIFFLDTPRSAEDVVALCYPAGGTYQGTIEVKFFSAPGAIIYYRRGGTGAFRIWSLSSPLYFSSDGMLQFYARLGAVSSPTYQLSYIIDQPGDVDTDGDEIPDFIEIERGMNPFLGNGDDDGDNWSTFHELLRGSDPDDPDSVPADSDVPSEMGEFGDGWADDDEIIRETDPFDSASAPVAPGVDIAEYTLTGIPESSIPISDSSRVDFFSLAGAIVHSASIQDGSFAVRLPGNQPYVVRVIEAENVDHALLGYIPSYVPCLNISSIYTPGMTGNEWLMGYWGFYESAMFIDRGEMIVSASSTAVVLAMGRLFENIADSTSAILIADASMAPSRSEVLDFKDSYFPDIVASYLESELAGAPHLVSTISAYLDWIVDDLDPSAPSHRLLARGIFGESVASASHPLAIEDADFALAAAEIDALLAVAPSRIVSISGTLASDPEDYVKIEMDGKTYELLLSTFGYRIGSIVSIEGRVVEQCERPEVTRVQVTSLRTIDSGVSGDVIDSDDDDLSDQWENFWFGTLDETGEDDFDSDGANNDLEFRHYTNPRDLSHYPPTPTATPTPTETILITPTATKTQSPTPTETPEPVNELPVVSLQYFPGEGVAPLSVSIIGSATDSDGILIQYGWAFDTPDILSATFTIASATIEAITTQLYSLPGEYQFGFWVWDDAGAIAGATGEVIVREATPTHTPSFTPTTTSTPTLESTITPTPTMKFPDFVLPPGVDAADLLEMIRGLFSEDEDCDLNRDGSHDYKDIFLFSRSWQKSP